ncbi:hypothetical protein [Streptomyces sioyaensis]|uniref:hypothetical protein n=1 Tax=Streptomyces sioyaensis TaxID=67364 RepID=UPI0036EA865D
MPTLAVLALAVPVVLVAAGTWGAGYQPTASELYGPALWDGLVPLLKLTEEQAEQQNRWMRLPDDLDAEGGALVIRLPAAMHGTERDRAALHEVVCARVPGEWAARWQTRGTERHVRFTRPCPGAGADAEFGPGLWSSLRVVLGVAAWEHRHDWLPLPENLQTEGSSEAEVRLWLPREWIGAPEQINVLFERRIPGDWVMHPALMGSQPSIFWPPKPAPKPKPQLPTNVEWVPSADRMKVMVGQTHQGLYYVDVGGTTPHWGVCGGTNDGKTTCLIIPVVHARQHGGLVDMLAPKVEAFDDVEGESRTGTSSLTSGAVSYSQRKVGGSTESADADKHPSKPGFTPS